MMTQTQDTAQPEVTIWQIIMLFLCIYVLGALFVDTAFKLPHETSILLTRSDNLVCLVFIGDFLFNLKTAKNKL
ncbi:MAG: ion transporter, partial [Candidatus Hydrogenedentes bacterium]|nr:ion transporter [Candidatus Hydrogenedentota bacterium]